jgi:putative FmdB family regulatory protein
MPTYEYQCQSCGHGFESFQKMSDEPVAACPECGGPVKRLLGAGGGFIVKGSRSAAAAGHPRQACCDPDNPCCGGDASCDRPPWEG